MIHTCESCHAVTATAGSALSELVCSACGSLLRAGDAAATIASEPCAELLLLPSSLREHSLSTDEILLCSPRALEAIGVLENTGVLLTGCECLIGTQTRLRHRAEYPGVERIRFPWFVLRQVRVKRAAQECRKVVRQNQNKHSFATPEMEESLYFSLFVELDRKSVV